MDEEDFTSQFNKNIAKHEEDNAYGVSLVPYHTHNGTDSPLVASSPSYFVIQDTTTVNFDLTKGDIQTVTLGGNRTLSVTNVGIGDRFILRLVQDSTGSRTVTWFPTIHWAGGSAPTLTTTANHWDDFGFICTALNVFDGLSVGQNIS